MSIIIESNRTKIFDYLTQHGECKIPEIVEGTGMAKSSVTAVLSRDQRRGIGLFVKTVYDERRGRRADVRYTVANGAERPDDPPNHRAMNKRTAPRKSGEYTPLVTPERYAWRPPQRDRTNVHVVADPQVMSRDDFVSACMSGFFDYIAGRRDEAA